MSIWQTMETLPLNGRVLLWVEDMPGHVSDQTTGPVHVEIVRDENDADNPLDFAIVNDSDYGYLSHWRHGPVRAWLPIPELDLQIVP